MHSQRLIAVLLLASACAKDPEKKQRPAQQTQPDPQPSANPTISGTPTNQTQGQQNVGPQTGFSDCGNQFTGAYAAQIDLQVTGVPLVGNVSIRGNSDLNVTATTQSANFQIDIKNVSTNPDNGLVRNRAQAEMEKLKGNISATFLTEAERAALLATPPYQGVKCTVMIVKQFKGRESTLEFTPGIPFLISPLAPQLLTSELPGQKTWSNIKVKVVQSSKEGLNAGEEMSGGVSLAPIAAQSSGLQGDHAYKISFQFGRGDQDLKRLGLFPSISYFVNSSQKTHNGLIIEAFTYETQKAPIVFKQAGTTTASVQ